MLLSYSCLAHRHVPEQPLGDDPFWEAVDLNYWATGDLEWYDPGMC